MQKNSFGMGLDGAPIVVDVPDEEIAGQGDKLLPPLWINTAIMGCVNAVDDTSFIKGVRRFSSVIRPNVKRRFLEAFNSVENKAKLAALCKSVPASYLEFPSAWTVYATADFQFELLMEAMYSSLSEERKGKL
jgi:hypothetical protein